jgi:N-acetylmuramoyl-L-alanine amidase
MEAVNERIRMQRLTTKLVFVGAFVAVDVDAATIDKVRVLDGATTNDARVEVDVSNRVPFKVYTLENPHRVVVDLADARLRAGVDVDRTPVPGREVTQIHGGPHGTGYRVVIDVADRLSGNAYMIASPNAHGDRLVVELKRGAMRAPTVAMVGSKATPSVPTTPVLAARATTAAPIANPTPAPKRNASAVTGPLRDFVVAIDAGHGGEDPGAIGVGRIQEKAIALAIAKELARLFDAAAGYRGDLTRSGDYYLTLRQRTTVARNRRADLFVSIHADSFSGRDASGASVYALSAKGATNEAARWLAEKENASDLIGGAGDVSLDDKDALLAHVLLDLSMDGNRSASIEAGSAVLDALNDFTQLHRNHVEQAGFVVLKSPDIPSILVETGYLSNATEARSLSQVAYQRKVAQAIFKGVTAYAQRHAPPGTTLAWRQQKRSPPS